MNNDSLTITLLALSGASYVLLTGISLLRRGLGRLAHWFVAYTGAGFLWELSLVAMRAGWLSNVRVDVAAHIPHYGLLVLALLLLCLTRSFLRLDGADWRWWVVGVTWTAATFLVDLNPLRWPEIWWFNNGWGVGRAGLASFVLIIGWGVFITGATLLTTTVYHRTQQPLHKNRLKYWVPVLGFTVLGDGLSFAGFAALGSGIRLLAVLAAAYAVLTHRLPDVRRIARRVLSYGIITLITIALYMLGFLGVQSVFQAVPGYSPLAVGAGVALILALLFNPLLGLVQRIVNRFISGSSYDPSRTVREYSLSISNIVEVDRLASVAVGLIDKVLGIRRGLLFLVDRKKGDGGRDHFYLRGVRGGGEQKTTPSGALPATSALAIHLQNEYFPLTQYDVDLLPRFRGLSVEERAWLTGLGMDVYVPIHSRDKWIGLLALGPKSSGDRYFDADLNLLRTLADQTAVALENSRLVEDLVRLNRNLDRANQHLEHLDRAKSDFISVVSHELRTPMSLMLGYSQILANDPEMRANADNFTLIQGLNRGAARLQEIVESMLDMAMIDTRTLQLARNPVSLDEIMQQVGREFAEPLTQRKLSLAISSLQDLPPIHADQEALSKVFYHLIINAIKYTPDGGKITVSGRRLLAGTNGQADDSIEIVVTDTGIGIDYRYQELIFDRFYQTGKVAVHSTGKTKFKGGGPGLGLTIARGIVEAHGGRIWVESPGYDEVKCPGSQFHVVLPVNPPTLQTDSDQA